MNSWTNICLKVLHREMIQAGVPDLKLKFPPRVCRAEVSGKSWGGDSVCAYWLHGTGRGVYGKEMVCSCVSAWSHSAQLWLSEKVRLWSSPCQIHTCCPRIGSKRKISCASVPKMLDVAENVPLRWSFGVRTELGMRQEWCVKDWSSFTEGLLRCYRMDSKGVSTQRQLARPWRESQGLNEGLGFHRTAESSGRRPTPGIPRHEDYRENEPENPEEHSLKHQCGIQAKAPEAFPRLEIGQ